MKLDQVLTDAQFSAQAREIFLSSGIKDLYPPQADAINKGILQGKSLLMSVPTAAGKTLIAELCMINAVLKNSSSRCLYIAPLKALASEKYNDFKKKYEPMGVQVGLAIGDIDSPSRYLNRYQIIVATAEKVDSLLRSKAKWLIDNLSVVVLDEIHFINDGLRGPTMEILTARIKQLNPSVQLLALSATIHNASEMAQWLKSELVVSSWRPIPLKEGVYQNDRIVFDGYGTRLINEEAPDDLSKLTLDTLRAKGQVLIFVNSRRSAQAVSHQVAGSTAKVLTEKERTELLAISKKIASGQSATKLCHKLAEVIKHGSAFHHAGLKPDQRKLIEDKFRENLIKVISCTPTLAAGVNLPARRAIIRDCKRFENGVGAAYIPTSEYKQCAGRAGRPQYDEYGEAVLIAKTNSEASTLFERYIHASPEPVTSKLADESALRIHILASIAGGYVHDVNGMFEFISHTFLYHQSHGANILELITDIFDFLNREQFIEKSGYRFFATPLGALTSRLYIDPLTTMTIREGINRIKDPAFFSAIGILHMITCCPDGPRLNVGKKDTEDVEFFASHNHNEFIFTPENYPQIDDFYAYLSTIKTTWMLSQWIEEEKEDIICDQFGVGPGDVYRHVEATQWLLYAATTVADLMRKKSLTFKLEDLRNRMRYGVKDELLDIVQLKGIGRIRARVLFGHGLKRLTDFKFATEDQLGGIKYIGKSLAKDIILQVQQGSFKKREKDDNQEAAVASSEPAEWED